MTTSSTITPSAGARSNTQVLECTLRDGSYAVDFRFTPDDTALLCRLLSELGFPLIEVGHGLGINASELGQGAMPGSDIELTRIAKASAPNAQIGMFCIPGIATQERLRDVAQEGLDFIRIGVNADDLAHALPFIESARGLNLRTYLNVMKSYAVSPETFGRYAKTASEAGAHGIYLVDSAGCMRPHEIHEYVCAVRAAVPVQIGFHGHNNLQLAVANTLQAIQSGADLVDTTLSGIGRSAGNAATEVVLALLSNAGRRTDVDLFRLMDVVDRFITPLMRPIRMHDMLSVAMGYARFHSSYLPAVQKIAERYQVDLRRLIWKAGRSHPSGINERELAAYAETLRSGARGSSTSGGHDLTTFSSRAIRPDRIANTHASVEQLMEELTNVCAKRRISPVVELTLCTLQDEQAVCAEYVTDDDRMALGRIQCGSRSVVDAVLDSVGERVEYFLVDRQGSAPWLSAEELAALVRRRAGSHRVILYASRELVASYLIDIVLNVTHATESSGLLLLGDAVHTALLAYRLAP
jgi:4-hydroxy-2-oxovalerate aldolase